jgi:hypothetical protein
MYYKIRICEMMHNYLRFVEINFRIQISFLFNIRMLFLMSIRNVYRNPNVKWDSLIYYSQFQNQINDNKSNKSVY